MPTVAPPFDSLAWRRPERAPVSHLKQNLGIAAVVLLLHGAALRALQNGLEERKAPAVLALPHVITAQLLAAPAPAPSAPATLPAPVEPQPPAAAPAPVTPPEPVAQKPKPKPKPKPKSEPARPAPQKPRVVARAPAPRPAPPRLEKTPAPAETAAAAPATPVAAVPGPAPAAPAAEPAPVRTVPPSSSAAYLNNPPPAYPALSRRLGESGTVVLRVLIGVNGRAEKARIDQSSGYERLDQAALETARDRWRYVPGTRNGVPEAMWFKVPIKFVLE